MNSIVSVMLDNSKMATKPRPNPEFEECERYTLDPYWLEIFKNCVKGKMPKSIKYTNDGTITVYVDKKAECISLNIDDGKELYLTMMDIFKNKLGMKSSRDIDKQRLELKKVKDCLMGTQGDEWKQVKPKKTKDALLLKYVLEKKNQYGLTSRQVRTLLSIIKLGMSFHSITMKDVDYHDGKIHEIKGIEYICDSDGHVKDFVIDIPKFVGSKKEKSSDCDRMIKGLKKYVKQYKVQTIKV